MKYLFNFLFTFLLITSCIDDKCEGLDCMPPPPAVYLNFIDESTGENVFESGRFESNDLTITKDNNLNYWKL